MVVTEVLKFSFFIVKNGSCCIDICMNKKQWQKIHAEYIKSDEFAWVRKQVIKRDKRCCRCGDKYIPGYFDVHHTEYTYFGDADINEVETCCLLCRPCHDAVHGIYSENIEYILENMLFEFEDYFGD